MAYGTILGQISPQPDLSNYVTDDSLNNTLSNYATQSWVSQQISTSSAKIQSGTYTGNGASSQNIALGFAPSAIIVTDDRGGTYVGEEGGRYYYCGGIAVKGKPLNGVTNLGAPFTVLSVYDNGFVAYYREVNGSSYIYVANTNRNDNLYYYIAFA